MHGIIPYVKSYWLINVSNKYFQMTGFIMKYKSG